MNLLDVSKNQLAIQFSSLFTLPCGSLSAKESKRHLFLTLARFWLAGPYEI